MAGGTIHHCLKRTGAGKNCRKAIVSGFNICTVHQVLCRQHQEPALKKDLCPKCIAELDKKARQEKQEKKEKDEKQKQEREEARKAQQEKDRNKKHRHKKN
ncbi:hypothetical protein F5Y13DRAFT_185586 [Hypoxylon sp. FL1857]|nr:hypothetical protein F5Y13DRAFT_185586 [Hypoxylon sp. FL1857]